MVVDKHLELVVGGCLVTADKYFEKYYSKLCDFLNFKCILKGCIKLYFNLPDVDVAVVDAQEQEGDEVGEVVLVVYD